MSTSNILGGILMGLSQGRGQLQQKEMEEEKERRKNLLGLLTQVAPKFPHDTQSEILQQVLQATIDPTIKYQKLAKFTSDVFGRKRKSPTDLAIEPKQVRIPGPPMAPDIAASQFTIPPPPPREVGELQAGAEQSATEKAQALKEQFRAQYGAAAEFREPQPPQPAAIIQVDIEDPPGSGQFYKVSIDERTKQVFWRIRIPGPAGKSTTPRLTAPKTVQQNYMGVTRKVLATFDENTGQWIDTNTRKTLLGTVSEVQEPTGIYSAYAIIKKDAQGKPVLGPDGQPILEYVSPSGAIGQEPAKTIVGPSGQVSLGGVSGYGTIPAPSVPEETQQSLAGWTQAIGMIDQITPQLEALRSQLGPFAGRVTLFEVNRLGGLGATQAQQKAAVDLRRLLMSQAFAEGGKQLTPTEKSEFIALNPALSDTFEQAVIKAQQARRYLRERYDIRLQMLGPRQRPQVPQTPPIPPALAIGSTLDPAVAAQIKEGHKATLSDGTVWQKVNGVVTQVK